MAFKSDKQRKGFFSTISSGGNASTRRIEKRKTEKRGKVVNRDIGGKNIFLPESKYKKYVNLRKESRDKYNNFLDNRSEVNAKISSNKIREYVSYEKQLIKDYGIRKGYVFDSKEHRKKLREQKERGQYKEYPKQEKGFMW